MNLIAPIIIIGCGRSGSTLLDRVLNAHPAIHMIGEAKFLPAKLWFALNDCVDGSMWNSGARLAQLYSGAESENAELPDEMEWAELERNRIAAIVNQAVSEAFDLSRSGKKLWGMKEIWNGGVDNIEWKIYDYIYPQATWVHIVRSPLGYVRSAFGWKGSTPTQDDMHHQLQTWMGIVYKSRERRKTGRYVEIRYEDLLKSPTDALSPLFSLLGEEWDANCQLPMRQNWVATRRLPSINQSWLEASIAKLGINSMITELGYSAEVPEGIREVTYAKKIKRDQSGNLLINRHIERGIGSYWLFVLSTAPAIRDALDEEGCPYFSLNDFEILENGVPLKRLQSRVDVFKGVPGCFFSNQEAIAFTSTDSSNPIKNGREYSICLVKNC